MARVLNISMDKLQDAKNTVKETVCTLPTDTLIYWFIIPILIALFILFLIRYKDFVLDKYYLILAKRGFIKIQYHMDNKRIKDIYKRLDKDNTFQFKKRRYSLEKLHEFIMGFDKNNFPVFFYDKNFIIPFKVTQENVTDEIKEQYKEATQEDLASDKVSAMYLKIDSTTLGLVYDRKLISDLYSLSTGEGMKKILVWGAIGLVALIFLYYTGYLEQILSYLGISLE